MELLRLITVVTTALCFICFMGCAPESRTDSKLSEDTSSAEMPVNGSDDDAPDELPTDELIKSIIEDPTFFEVYLFDTYEMGIEHINEKIAAMSVLKQRDDAAEVLLEKYADAKVYSDSEIDLDDSEALEEANRIGCYEILICQRDILSAMTEEQRQQFADTVYEKYQEKKQAGRKDFNHPAQPYVLTFEDEESYSSEYIYNKVAEYCASK